MRPKEHPPAPLLSIAEAEKLTKAELRHTPHEHAVAANPYKSALVCVLCGLLRRDPIHGERS
jgi:hypothetical protein